MGQRHKYHLVTNSLGLFLFHELITLTVSIVSYIHGYEAMADYCGWNISAMWAFWCGQVM